jgi:hypothetical protein
MNLTELFIKKFKDYTLTIKINEENGYRHYHWLKNCTTESYGVDNECNVPGFDINYKWNSLGFRGAEPSKNNKSLVTFGCSFTTGVGVSEEDRFGDVVADRIKCQHYCFGTPAADNLTIFHNFIRLFSSDAIDMNIDTVLIFWTYKSRFTWLDNNDISTEYYSDIEDGQWQVPFIEQWDQFVSGCYLEEMMRAVDMTCRNKNIKLIQTSADTTVKIDNLSSFVRYNGFDQNGEFRMDKGRDGRHPGPSTHKKIADFFENSLTKN